MYTVPYLQYQLVTSLFDQLKFEGYSERAMFFFFSCLDRPQSRHVMLSPFFQPCYSTVLNEKYNNLLPTFSRCAAVNHYSATATKIGICEFQLHRIEFNVPRTNFSTKQLRVRTRCYRTKPVQPYPRAFSLRPNQVLFVFAIFKRVIGEKMLALRLRTSTT